MIGKGFKTKEEMLNWRKENHGCDEGIMGRITAMIQPVMDSAQN